MKNKKTIRASLFLSIIPIILFFNSCKDNPAVNNPVTYDIVTSLGGNVTGLSSSNPYVRAIVSNAGQTYVVASHLMTDSTFTLILTVPPAGYLIDIDDFFVQNFIQGVSISDNSANVNIMPVNVYDTTNILRGSLQKLNHGPNENAAVGQISVSVFYCDRPLTITGKNTLVIGIDTTVVNYNATLGTGWNVTTLRTTKLSNHYIEYSFINGEIPGAKWYYKF
ncbi:MAG: hypothetical protein SGI89_08460 [bacterium]|nr:hypothetical protein [bacterium]